MDSTKDSGKAQDPDFPQGDEEKEFSDMESDSFVSQEATIRTDIDDLIKLISKNKEISMADAAKALGVPQQTVDAWSIFLEEDGVIDVKYKLTTPYLVVKEPKAAKSAVAAKAEQEDIEKKGSILIRKPAIDIESKDSPLIEARNMPQLFKEATKDVDALFNTAYSLIKQGKFDEANSIYEQIKQENERLPKELKEYKKDISLNLTKLNKDLIVNIEKYNLRTSIELSKYIDKKIPKLARQVELGNIQRAEELYTEIEAAFSAFPPGFEIRKSELKTKVIEVYKKLLVRKKELLIKYNNLKSQQIRKLVDEIKAALNSWEMDKAVAKYGEAKNLYAELPEGFAEENETLTKELFSLVPDLISRKKKHSSDEFQSQTQKLRTLIKLTYDSIRQGKIEAAERYYSELKELHTTLPKDFFTKMVDLESEILELEHHLLLHSKSSSLLMLKQLSSSIDSMLKSSKDYLKRNNVELAEGMYYELLSKYRQIPEGFIEQKTVIGVDILNLFREIMLKYDEDMLKGLDENTNQNYKKIIQLLTTLRGDIEEERLDAIEHKFSEISELFGKLPFRFVQDNTKLWKEVQLLSSEIELFQKTRELPDHKDNPQYLNNTLAEIRKAYLQIAYQFQDFPAYSKLLGFVKNNYLFYYNMLNRTGLSDIPPEDNLPEFAMPPKISIGTYYPQDRMPTPEPREAAPRIPPREIFDQFNQPPQKPAEIHFEPIALKPTIDTHSEYSQNLPSQKAESPEIQYPPYYPPGGIAEDQEKAWQPTPDEEIHVEVEDVESGPLPEGAEAKKKEIPTTKKTPKVVFAAPKSKEPSSKKLSRFISDYISEKEEPEKSAITKDNLSSNIEQASQKEKQPSKSRKKLYLAPEEKEKPSAREATRETIGLAAKDDASNTSGGPTSLQPFPEVMQLSPEMIKPKEPEPIPPEITPAKLKDNLITNLLASAGNRMRLGRLDEAETTYQQILFFDGFNTEARDRLEEIRALRAKNSPATLGITTFEPKPDSDSAGYIRPVSRIYSPSEGDKIDSLNSKLKSFDMLINSELGKRSAEKGRKGAKKQKNKPGERKR